MLNKILFAIGLSLLIGIAVGYFTSEQNYYLVFPGEPKRETTFENYQSLIGEDCWGEDCTNYVKIEEEYNLPNAFIFGLGTLGALAIIISIFHKIKTK